MYFYLHGFSSSARSHKASELRRRLADEFYIADYPAHAPEHALPTLRLTLDQYCNRQLPIILIGSSLGGLYALLLAQEYAIDRVALINPCLDPQTVLAPYVGKQKNLSTGEDLHFTQAHLLELGRLSLSIEHLPANLLILMDQDDELIDVPALTRRYADRARVVVYPGGSHAFEHLDQAAVEIARLAQRC